MRNHVSDVPTKHSVVCGVVVREQLPPSAEGEDAACSVLLLVLMSQSVCYSLSSKLWASGRYGREVLGWGQA